MTIPKNIVQIIHHILFTITKSEGGVIVFVLVCDVGLELAVDVPFVFVSKVVGFEAFSVLELDVGFDVGLEPRFVVGEPVGDPVGDPVGELVVGEPVGDFVVVYPSGVGDLVVGEDVVGDSVGEAVGFDVGLELGFGGSGEHVRSHGICIPSQFLLGSNPLQLQYS